MSIEKVWAVLIVILLMFFAATKHYKDITVEELKVKQMCLKTS